MNEVGSIILDDFMAVTGRTRLERILRSVKDEAGTPAAYAVYAALSLAGAHFTGKRLDIKGMEETLKKLIDLVASGKILNDVTKEELRKVLEDQ